MSRHLSHGYTRRSVIALFGGAGAALIAACGGPAPTATSVPAKAVEPAKPAEAPKPPAPAPASTKPAVAAAVPATAAAAAPATAPAAAKPAEQAKPVEAAKPAAPVPASTRTLTKEKINLVFIGHVAGGEGEQKAYDTILDTWNKTYPNIQAEYQVVNQDRIPKIQAMVAANQAPDMWRHAFSLVRLWGWQGHLLDLTDLMPKGYDKLFIPGLMAGNMLKGRYFGLPHTTDTSAMFYREDSLEAIGVKVPTELKDSWSWEQWSEINDKLLKLGKQQLAFTHNQGSASRWLGNFLYSAGGQTVTNDFSKMAINSPEGVSALKFTKEWTDKKWVPPTLWTSTTPNEDTNPFVRGTTAMGLLGVWNTTYLDDNIKQNFKWNVTYLPKNKIQTTSLGGTPIVGWSKTKYKQEVGAFFEFFDSAEMVKQFDEMANYVPVRLDLLEQKLNYKTRPDLMQVFFNQIRALPEHFAAFAARSYADGVITIVHDELAKMGLQGQSPEDTAKAIEAKGNKFIQDNPDVEMR